MESAMNSSNPARSTLDVIATMIDILKFELNVRMEENFSMFHTEDYKQWITNIKLIEEKLELMTDMPTFNQVKGKIEEIRGLAHHMMYVVSLKLYVFSVLTHHEELSRWVSQLNRIHEIIDSIYRIIEIKPSLHVFATPKAE